MYTVSIGVPWKFLIERGILASPGGTPMTVSISVSIAKNEYFAFSHFELGLHYDL